MKKKYTYREFERDLEKIVKKLKPHLPSIENIFGIPRGGTVVAVHLSYRTGKPLLFDKDKINERTLVVDDISDTGGTLNRLLQERNCKIVVALFTTPHTDFQPHIFCRVKQSRDWIIFPWETKESSKYDKTEI